MKGLMLYGFQRIFCLFANSKLKIYDAYGESKVNMYRLAFKNLMTVLNSLKLVHEITPSICCPSIISYIMHLLDYFSKAENETRLTIILINFISNFNYYSNYFKDECRLSTI